MEEVQGERESGNGLPGGMPVVEVVEVDATLNRTVGRKSDFSEDSGSLRFGVAAGEHGALESVDGCPVDSPAGLFEYPCLEIRVLGSFFLQVGNGLFPIEGEGFEDALIEAAAAPGILGMENTLSLEEHFLPGAWQLHDPQRPEIDTAYERDGVIGKVALAVGEVAAVKKRPILQAVEENGRADRHLLGIKPDVGIGFVDLAGVEMGAMLGGFVPPGHPVGVGTPAQLEDDPFLEGYVIGSLCGDVVARFFGVYLDHAKDKGVEGGTEIGIGGIEEAERTGEHFPPSPGELRNSQGTGASGAYKGNHN
jgi:hypothetical protein